MNSEIKQYFDDLPVERRTALEKLLKLILDTVPNINLTRAYGMPTFELNGIKFCAIASQKHYMAFYLMDTDVLDEHRAAFYGLDVGKSCIRFKNIEQLDLTIIQIMLKKSLKKKS
ncbi:DUF1801 domain-containing protein [candidate division KSB1 bacterium]|nr:DUF1801 domain-containing protein [candidate division KSB1 bacterium]